MKTGLQVAFSIPGNLTAVSFLELRKKAGKIDVSNSQSRFDRMYVNKKVKKLTVMSLQI